VTHLRINTPGVVHETVDGEVVIVNLDNGLYFSTDRVGTSVWNLLARAEPVAAIIDWASATYNGAAPDIAADVTTFLSQLEQHELVVPVDEAPEPQVDGAPLPAPASYAPPELQIYSDMEELLLLDPVHDVGDAGWPYKA
jgi:hypothetical protein